MALWYECGNGMVKTSFAKKDERNDAYIVCPGPSLKNVNPDSFSNRVGYTVVGITTSYPAIKPDIWVGLDRVECYDRMLWWEGFVKICRGNYNGMVVEGLPIKSFRNTFFADCIAPTNQDDIFTLRAHDIRFVWHKNTLAMALHLLIWMGFKKIHFVGCDLTTGYFDGRMIGKAREESNLNLHNQLYTYLKWFSKTGEKHGIETINCSPGSRLNDFMDFIPLDAAIVNSQRKTLGFKGFPIFHAADAEKMYSGLEDISDNQLFLKE